ncbi:hypothetical protein N9L68_03235 [bacterium]|nr:hypothetical protein [bacterium]
MDSKHAFEMLVQNLKAQIGYSEDDVGEKSEMKAEKLHAKADAEGSLSETIATMESRQALQAKEPEAIGKAKEIISSSAVAGSAEKHLPSLLQVNAQLLADERSPTQDRVASYPRGQARSLHSWVPAALSVHVADDRPSR